jgi:hypothetical protein
MKKIILTTVILIVLAAAAFGTAALLIRQQPTPSADNSQDQTAPGKSEPGVIQSETGLKSSLPDKAGNISDSNLSPEQQRLRDAKQNQ